MIAGWGKERVLRAPLAGVVRWQREIGDLVVDGERLGAVGGDTIRTPVAGMVRGLMADGSQVPAGLKIGDVDPRRDQAMCAEISDKALEIGGGVVEAVLSWRR